MIWKKMFVVLVHSLFRRRHLIGTFLLRPVNLFRLRHYHILQYYVLSFSFLRILNFRYFVHSYLPFSFVLLCVKYISFDRVICSYKSSRISLNSISQPFCVDTKCLSLTNEANKMAFLLKDFSTILLTFLILSLSAAAFILSYFYTYWKRRGVKYLQPSIPLGNYGPSFLQKISIAELGQKLYKSTTEPFIGVYAAFRPTLLVRDPECIRRILIKDFQHFTDRGVYYDEQNDPLSAHLFAIGGEKWKNLRSKLSPTFTSGKLKAMFSTLIECGNVLQTYIDKVAEQKGNIELRELAARYNTSVIASVGFGVDINCIDNPNTSFRKYGRQFFAINLKNGLRFLAMFLFPGILKVFKIRLIDRDIEDFMMSLVKQTLEFREKNNVLRKDFFQLLVQLRNTGTVQLDDQWETVIVKDEKEKNNRLTLKEMGAQAFVFYAAGFETTSTTMSYCMYEIARNPDIQTKLHHEIDEVLAKHNGQINYDSVSEMKYLESCIDGECKTSKFHCSKTHFCCLSL